MSASYAREKLGAAVHALAVGTGSIQKRLLDAFINMSALSERDFDGVRLEEWRSIYARATAREPVADEGRYQASLFAMCDDEAAQLARDICELEAMMDLERGF